MKHLTSKIIIDSDFSKLNQFALTPEIELCENIACDMVENKNSVICTMLNQ